ncbi:MAG: DUF2461 domain-containing protein [Bacteroidales bacterium]|nr:DUF2461 domain-containing protein [Bacteroidales bacterium]
MAKYDIEQMLDFLREIKVNNNTEWMNANRGWYEQVRDGFKAMSQEILIKLQAIDPSLGGLEVKNCIYRFNRDTRFSPDKAPYKRHLASYFAPGGKKAVTAGYYFHLQPFDSDDTFFGQTMLCSGIWAPPTEGAKLIREEIFYGGGEALTEILNRDEIKKHFGNSYNETDKLKVIPKNLKGSEYEELIRLKSWLLIEYLSDEDCLKNDFVDYVVETFRITKDFNDFFNEILLDANLSW